MEEIPHELYENARRRIKQKKILYFHFVVFFIGNIFLILINHFSNIGNPYQWSVWILTIWSFVFIMHFVKVFITDRFMNKDWERTEINRLVAKQQKKIQQFESEITNQNKTE